MHLPALGANLARPPGRDRPAVAADDGIVARGAAQAPRRSPVASSARRAACRAPPSAATIPPCPPVRVSRKRRSSCRCSSGSSAASVRRLSPTSPTSIGIAQTRCAPGRARSARRALGPASGRNSIYGNDVPTISSVSQSSIASCDGSVPSSPIVPVVYGLSSGTAAFPSSALTIGAPSISATFQLVGGVERAAPGKNHDLLAGIQDLGGRAQIVFVAAAARCAQTHLTCGPGCSASTALS